MARSKPPKQPDGCPKCGSKKVASILYGLPMFDEEPKRRINAVEIVLGGCCISGDDPLWYCNACRHHWGGEDNGIEGDDRRPG